MFYGRIKQLIKAPGLSRKFNPEENCLIEKSGIRQPAGWRENKTGTVCKTMPVYCLKSNICRYSRLPRCPHARRTQCRDIFGGI